MLRPRPDLRICRKNQSETSDEKVQKNVRFARETKAYFAKIVKSSHSPYASRKPAESADDVFIMSLTAFQF